MIRAVSALVLALCSVWLCCEPAFAARRIALVIGNSVYERVPQLQNPVQDATAMSQMFKAAAFDAVTLKLDLKASEMRRALRDFSEDARDADIAIIYFAGHGLEIQGTNYLIPVDAVLERDIDAFDEAVPLDRLLHAMEPARQLRLVILDACRDNPFAKSMKHGAASRPLRTGQRRAHQPEHAGRLCRQGRVDRCRRHYQEQSVHRCADQISADVGPRSSQGVRLRARRGFEGDA
jgi:Caspase domain